MPHCVVVQVREATSNDPWGPSSSLMSEIADLTYNVVAFSEIMSMVWKRLNDHGKNWRHVYKVCVSAIFSFALGVYLYYIVLLLSILMHAHWLASPFWSISTGNVIYFCKAEDDIVLVDGQVKSLCSFPAHFGTNIGVMYLLGLGDVCWIGIWRCLQWSIMMDNDTVVY